MANIMHLAIKETEIPKACHFLAHPVLRLSEFVMLDTDGSCSNSCVREISLR